jgi:hypothetical protein
MLLDDSVVHPSYDVAIWINTTFFSQAFRDAFLAKWKEMKKIS